jgi:DNA mismatch repair protein MutL
MIAALEEAYRNQIMVGKFPACVLHLHLPADCVDVNVHPAKTEVKFLNEKAVFDCIHYGVLGALNRATDRPQMQFKSAPAVAQPVQSTPPLKTPASAPAQPSRKENFYRTMTTEEYKTFTQAVQTAPQPKTAAAAATVAKIEQHTAAPLRETVILPTVTPKQTLPPRTVETPILPVEPEPEQTQLPMPAEIPWRLVGELYNSYIIVEQGEDAFLIDKHAAHERILFERLKANQEKISSQTLLTPLPVRLTPDATGELLSNGAMLEELGFELEEFGENTVLVRQIPMDLDQDDAADALETLAADLMNGRKERKDTVRDELLHTVACKAAIKAGWITSETELLALVKQVMADEDLKHCPHGRPICITLSKKQLEKQFKRS